MREMTNIVLIILLTVLLRSCDSEWTWVNDYDQHFRFECTMGQYLSGVQSAFSDYHHDRKFRVQCTPDYRSYIHYSYCSWTDYANEMDMPLIFQCRDGGLISGIESFHDNHFEDRKFKFKCCHYKYMCTYDCFYTGWLNSFGAYYSYEVPHNHFVRGIVSLHNNVPEDRVFDFEVCSINFDCDHTSPTTTTSTTTTTTPRPTTARTTYDVFLLSMVHGDPQKSVPILGRRSRA